MSYTKRNSDNPSDLMLVEEEMLSSRMAVLIHKGEDENYYTRRRGEICIDWLRPEVSIDDDKRYVWQANMPLPFWQCEKIFEASRLMPKKNVMTLVFPDYELNADEMILFDVVFEYGRSCGLEVIAQELYSGAAAGDPRAVKMYLDMMGLIGQEELDDETAVKRLMRVELKL